jgi:carbamoylphosphate synthase large subunit
VLTDLPGSSSGKSTGDFKIIKELKKKRILFLGGTFSQIPAVKYAREKGLYIITVDNVPQNPGHSLSDEYYNISTVDKENILRLSESLKIDAITAYASDPSAITAAYVSEKMNLTGSSFNAVKNLSNKRCFRELLKKSGYNYPWFIAADNVYDLKKKYKGGLAVIKPVDSSGSKGVSLISNKNDIEAGFNYSLHHSISREVILEQYIERKGPQVHGEGFVVNGELVFIMLGDQIFSEVNPLAPYSTTIPGIIHKRHLNYIRKVVENIIKKTGFITGGINVEAICDVEDNIYIMEIGPRSGGNLMPQLIFYSTGYDLTKANIDSLFGIGVNPDYSIPEKKFFSQVILHSGSDGILEKVNKPDLAGSTLLGIEIFGKYGMSVRVYKNSRDVIGVLIYEHSDLQSYLKFTEVLNKNPWVTIRNGN